MQVKIQKDVEKALLLILTSFSKYENGTVTRRLAPFCSRYRISSFKRRGVYLILEHLGTVFIRGWRLFKKQNRKKRNHVSIQNNIS